MVMGEDIFKENKSQWILVFCFVYHGYFNYSMCVKPGLGGSEAAGFKDVPDALREYRPTLHDRPFLFQMKGLWFLTLDAGALSWGTKKFFDFGCRLKCGMTGLLELGQPSNFLFDTLRCFE